MRANAELAKRAGINRQLVGENGDLSNRAGAEHHAVCGTGRSTV